MYLAINLLYFANVSSFKLQVHIALGRDQDEMMITHPM